MSINGTLLSYDPGGNSSHGVSLVTFKQGRISNVEIHTLKTAEEVISVAINTKELVAVGVDTLSCWSTGHSGWRPADRWLRKKYRVVLHSIASPNSLFGSMGLNGMAVLIYLREQFPNITITETHPKVLYKALTGYKYDYIAHSRDMDEFLSNAMEFNISTNNDHEWDSIFSVYAVCQGLRGIWKRDLHTLPIESERIIKPCGDTVYWWPE